MRTRGGAGKRAARSASAIVGGAPGHAGSLPAIGRYPKDAIGFATADEPRAVEAPGIVLRKSAAKSGAHGEAGHPAAALQHPARVVAGRQSARPVNRVCRVQVAHHAAQHLDGQRVECRSGPDRDAEARGFQSLANWSSTLDEMAALPVGRPARRARSAASSAGNSCGALPAALIVTPAARRPVTDAGAPPQDAALDGSRHAEQSLRQLPNPVVRRRDRPAAAYRRAARLVRRRQHERRCAHHVEIAQQARSNACDR